MKKLIYQIPGYAHMYHPETEETEPCLSFLTITKDNPSDEDVARAAQIACNGEYILEDDGIEAPTQPTQEQRLTELEEALEMILSGVTE